MKHKVLVLHTSSKVGVNPIETKTTIASLDKLPQGQREHPNYGLFSTPSDRLYSHYLATINMVTIKMTKMVTSGRDGI